MDALTRLAPNWEKREMLEPPPGCLTLKMTKNLTSDATFSVSDVSEEGSHFEWKRQFKHKQTFDFSVQDLL